ncbi:hypothetical protein LHP98_08150 [Rhodobacter sp. Har01]|uniref:hypothetical protein n=1 Tax=Rhodobacter sp. Har01 TaxID=2883999 RepID=UPI001D07D0D5|nr:hypothetical protein [Rhodobacter sp. Har01]MCB6178101.1 hypothetical protein [Rhodobacter sp. Har01]
MEAFKRQEVAGYASVAEAALWLAFGELPDANWREVREYRDEVGAFLGEEYYWTDGQSLYVDSRVMPEEILEFGGSQFSFSPYLSASLLREILPGVDIVLYNKMVELCDDRSPDEIREQNQRFHTNFEAIRHSLDPAKVDFEDMEARCAEMEKENRNELEAAIWLNMTLAPVRHALSRAQAAIFGALADGRLVGHGVWLVPDDEGTPEGVVEVPWATVAKELWTLEGIDWRKSNLKVVGGSYWGIVVETRLLLSEFAKPKLSPRRITADLFGDTILLNGQAGSGDEIAARRPRGQPQKLEIIAEKLLVAHLARRLEEGFPYQKEALVREAQVWAESIGVQVGRSTFERTISRIMTDLPRK